MNLAANHIADRIVEARALTAECHDGAVSARNAAFDYAVLTLASILLVVLTGAILVAPAVAYFTFWTVRYARLSIRFREFGEIWGAEVDRLIGMLGVPA